MYTKHFLARINNQQNNFLHFLPIKQKYANVLAITSKRIYYKNTIRDFLQFLKSGVQVSIMLCSQAIRPLNLNETVYDKHAH